MNNLSDAINDVIDVSIENYNGDYDHKDIGAISSLISLGEIIDRLSIVNFKLFTLKNKVMRCQEDRDFLADAAITDIHLVEERARLKRAIDEKLEHYLANRFKYNPEEKDYS